MVVKAGQVIGNGKPPHLPLQFFFLLQGAIFGQTLINDMNQMLILKRLLNEVGSALL